MSETGADASNSAQQGVLYDASGNRITRNVMTEAKELDPLVRFARKQSITTVVLALGLGYLIAKLL